MKPFKVMYKSKACWYAPDEGNTKNGRLMELIYCDENGKILSGWWSVVKLVVDGIIEEWGVNETTGKMVGVLIGLNTLPIIE